MACELHVNKAVKKKQQQKKMKRDNTRLEMQELPRLESSPKGLKLALGGELVALSQTCGIAKRTG